VTLPPPRETRQFDTAHIGRRVLRFDQLDSTNSAAAILAARHEPGLVVVADHQTAGRGQHGRVWQARPGSSLLMSAALRPPQELCRPVILTALAAVAVGDAVLALTGAQARIKWPNDLLIRGKKVCGILIENTTTTVIGIGLNLNQTAEEFADAGLPDATSLGLLAECPIYPDVAAEVVVRKLDAEYDRLLRGERVAVEADWKWRVGLLGRQVAVELTDGSMVCGRLREMTFDRVEVETREAGVRVLVPETVRHITAESL
jgi:BirA family transcriptional regulator, biotin operon repressor / biotin---[acetyl-CoA-carboxylase] ligase